MATTSAVRPTAVRPVRVPKASAPTIPRLTVLAKPRTARSSLPFTLLCTLIVAATLAALLYMNIQMSSTSYEITRLQGQSQRLTEQQQALSERNALLDTPQELERQAREIGMVPVSDPAYIDLGTGTVMGDSTPIAGDVDDEATVSSAEAVPRALIEDESSTYHGMGNEGD